MNPRDKLKNMVWDDYDLVVMEGQSLRGTNMGTTSSSRSNGGDMMGAKGRRGSTLGGGLGDAMDTMSVYTHSQADLLSLAGDSEYGDPIDDELSTIEEPAVGVSDSGMAEVYGTIDRMTVPQLVSVAQVMNALCNIVNALVVSRHDLQLHKSSAPYTVPSSFLHQFASSFLS